MSRNDALALAAQYYDSGEFFADLARRVACPTESQNPQRAQELQDYLRREIGLSLENMGFELRQVDNAQAGKPPLLLARRIEDAALPTVLMYGHGDVVNGQEGRWQQDRSPWALSHEGDKCYGRGTADNKGQHSINLGALAATLKARAGKLGVNLKMIFEMSEEIGSPGLLEACTGHAEFLRADLFLASDGPRLAAGRPTVFLGSRGALQFRLTLDPQNGAHHAGNWGGVLLNPAMVLAHAAASLVSADGVIQVAGLRPPPVTPRVRQLVSDFSVGADAGDPALAAGWGEPGLTPAERLFAWNTLEMIAFEAGNAARPVGAIPAIAQAVFQLRFVVGTDWENAEQHLRRHLDAGGFHSVQLSFEGSAPATRLDPDDPWVAFATASMQTSSGKPVSVLPNLGGTIPNHCFSEALGLPTIWVPHSYPSCSQHAPDEHLLGSVAREGLQLMAGLLWDLGEQGDAVRRQRSQHGQRQPGRPD
ncbi:M20 family metallopeptidase [Herbaspirillum lusitanum]|uniref:M20 family metallopeptidase n=1 Tax=Herbaspirillum lusitanum TaxID=213312 RepID=A0ABW9AFJ4_9BURK